MDPYLDQLGAINQEAIGVATGESSVDQPKIESEACWPLTIRGRAVRGTDKPE
jgi:hypothetical protein